MGYYLKDQATIWWKSLESEILKLCHDDEIEELFLDKWSHTIKKKTKNPSKDFILQEKIMVLLLKNSQKEKSHYGQNIGNVYYHLV